MAQDKDKLADALSAMFNGGHEEEHAEPEAQEHDIAESQAADEAPPAPEPVPAPAPAAAAPRPAAQPARPSRPAAPSVATPQPAPQVPNAPASTRRPARPSAPTATSQSAAPSPVGPSPVAPARAARPSAPVVDRPPEPVAPVSYARKNVKPAKQALTGTIEFRRALIPSCLVLGVLFPLLTILFFARPKTDALRAIPPYLPIAMAVIGVVLLAIGALNMVLVKNELDAKKPK